MLQIPIPDLPEPVRQMLRADRPIHAALRREAVLQGIANGRVFVDDPSRPTWAVLQEAGFGSLYLGGALDRAALSAIVAVLRADSDVLVPLRSADERLALLPEDPVYDGWVMDYWDRAPAPHPPNPPPLPPPGFSLVAASPETTRGQPGEALILAMHGSLERAFETAFGFHLVKDGQITCESLAGCPVDGVTEIGIETHPAFRRRGLATFLSAYVVREAERRGLQTFWSCNMANLPSMSLGLKLGYRARREYRLVAWPRLGTEFT